VKLQNLNGAKCGLLPGGDAKSDSDGGASGVSPRRATLQENLTIEKIAADANIGYVFLTTIIPGNKL
jgi:hypothetical protein